ncbi:hypothetical protein [Croceicoccus mobilis]|uniref:DUF1173 domain-containing protein n=1 Tax=Croceicoccus mobilis TaxID=1703339 RepID=A0A916Z9F9_9SPHN|nr:hypothetical protein [Croceicoccus mobilis]GGD82320.1 hypothetical protein GCM10010990_35430 [Croceicoccus mobilis]
MWLVPKDTTGRTARHPIPDSLKQGLIRWYTGKGSEADHRASVSLVVTARENHKWIACDCRPANDPPALLSPAYLSFQETYYLRRLTSRPQHKRNCPFYMPQAPQRLRETTKDALYEVNPPKGLFLAHQKAPEKLAQKPLDTDPDDRSRGVAIPRLARLLWQLVEAAQTNVIRALPPSGRAEHSISAEMARLRKASHDFQIAPGIALSDHIYTTAIDFEKKRTHARLRAAAETWPEDYAPQAFLLLEANEISSSEIVTGLGTIEIRNRIQHTGIIRAEVQPPFLVLAVVGEHSKREGYRALRAYAQPVLSGNEFIPTDREDDRSLLRTLQATQSMLHSGGIKLAIKKLVFDIQTKQGSVRPDFMLAFHDTETGAEGYAAVQVLRSHDPNYLQLRQLEYERLIAAWPTISLALEHFDANLIAEEIASILEQRKGGGDA